jgi:uncharacterized BrkB/YihY/UPF0761 family membrane protein
MKDLETRIAAIEARNRKVEQDKAWETSWTRRISVAVLTYAVIVAYLVVINNNNPWVNAAVPAVGFMLSTMAMSWVQSIWRK